MWAETARFYDDPHPTQSPVADRPVEDVDQPRLWTTIFLFCAVGLHYLSATLGNTVWWIMLVVYYFYCFSFCEVWSHLKLSFMQTMAFCSVQGSYSRNSCSTSVAGPSMLCALWRTWAPLPDKEGRENHSEDVTAGLKPSWRLQALLFILWDWLLPVPTRWCGILI